MAGYRTSFKKNSAYLIGEDDLKRLRDIAATFVGNDPEITFELVGDHKIEDTDLSALVSDSYVASKRLLKVSIHGRNSKPSRSIHIEFDSAAYVMDFVSVDINGDKKHSVSARTEIETVIDGLQVWYGRFFLPPHMSSYMVGFTFPLVASFAVAAYLVIRPGQQFPPTELPVTVLPLGGLIYLVYQAAKTWAFPHLAFEIGRSKRFANGTRTARNFLLTAMVLGPVIKWVVDKYLLR